MLRPHKRERRQPQHRVVGALLGQIHVPLPQERVACVSTHRKSPYEIAVDALDIDVFAVQEGDWDF